MSYFAYHTHFQQLDKLYTESDDRLAFLAKHAVSERLRFGAKLVLFYRA
jgi:hypothetical protein